MFLRIISPFQKLLGVVVPPLCPTQQEGTATARRARIARARAHRLALAAGAASTAAAETALVAAAPAAAAVPANATTDGHRSVASAFAEHTGVRAAGGKQQPPTHANAAGAKVGPTKIVAGARTRKSGAGTVPPPLVPSALRRRGGRFRPVALVATDEVPQRAEVSLTADDEVELTPDPPRAPPGTPPVGTPQVIAKAIAPWSVKAQTIDLSSPAKLQRNRPPKAIARPHMCL